MSLTIRFEGINPMRSKTYYEGRQIMLEWFSKACHDYYITGKCKLTDQEFDGMQHSAKVVYPEFMEVWTMIGYNKELVDKYRKIND